MAVSAVHLLFDVLAFKNDVSFWSSVDSMEGLSSRTLILNQIMEAVILAYLFEEDASWLVKITYAALPPPPPALGSRIGCVLTSKPGAIRAARVVRSPLP